MYCYGGQLKKMTDRVEKNRKEVEATRGKYDAALSDLNTICPRVGKAVSVRQQNPGAP